MSTIPTGTVAAELAPIGVQLWPTTSPEYARNFTLSAVEITTRKIRERDGSWFEYPPVVVWTYESGQTRKFSVGEMVAVDAAVAAPKERETVWCESHYGGTATPHFEVVDCMNPHYTDAATRARMNEEASRA